MSAIKLSVFDLFFFFFCIIYYKLKLTIQNRRCNEVRINEELSDQLKFRRRASQGIVLSTPFFNLVLEKTVRREITHNKRHNLHRRLAFTFYVSITE